MKLIKMDYKQFTIKIMDKFPFIHIQLSKYYNNTIFNFIDIDIGRNKSNNNYWFDVVLLGIGFNYDSSCNNSLRIINNWRTK